MCCTAWQCFQNCLCSQHEKKGNKLFIVHVVAHISQQRNTELIAVDWKSSFGKLKVKKFNLNLHRSTKLTSFNIKFRACFCLKITLLMLIVFLSLIRSLALKYMFVSVQFCRWGAHTRSLQSPRLKSSPLFTISSQCHHSHPQKEGFGRGSQWSRRGHHLQNKLMIRP